MTTEKYPRVPARHVQDKRGHWKVVFDCPWCLYRGKAVGHVHGGDDLLRPEGAPRASHCTNRGSPYYGRTYWLVPDGPPPPGAYTADGRCTHCVAQDEASEA
jgi:hypothetical protein